MQQTVRIYTNHVPGGWEHTDLESPGLGGSEECIVELAEALGRVGYSVYVYHTQRERYPKFGRSKNVIYHDRIQYDFDRQDSDILITFKDPSPHKNKYQLNVHWSSDVETPYSLDNIDAFVNLTEFHQLRNCWVDDPKSYVIPHGVDTESLSRHCEIRDANLAIYCSSPDRGLLTLLENWKQIKSYYPRLKLKITYGWHLFDHCTGGNPSARAFKKHIIQLMGQPDIIYVGQLKKTEMERLYHQATYWLLPLNRPDSELFCLNAVKSQYAGCLPVINRLGALYNTVGQYIDYQQFIRGQSERQPAMDNVVPAQSWDEIVSTYWLPLFKKLSEGIGI